MAIMAFPGWTGAVRDFDREIPDGPDALIESRFGRIQLVERHVDRSQHRRFHFATPYRNRSGRRNPQPYLVADDSYHFNRDIAANHNFFIEFAGQNQHDVHSFAMKRVKLPERENLDPRSRPVLGNGSRKQDAVATSDTVLHGPVRTAVHRHAKAIKNPSRRTLSPKGQALPESHHPS
jgi:hypothetical protein